MIKLSSISRSSTFKRLRGVNGHQVFFGLGDLQFEWDSEKAEGNLVKHKLSFEEGATVFQDYSAFLLDENEYVDDETRFGMVGYSKYAKMLVVVHVVRGPRFRIVSVRQPTKPERRLYEEDPLRR